MPANMSDTLKAAPDDAQTWTARPSGDRLAQLFAAPVTGPDLTTVLIRKMEPGVVIREILTRPANGTRRAENRPAEFSTDRGLAEEIARRGLQPLPGLSTAR